jgi:hypothetical protein
MSIFKSLIDVDVDLKGLLEDLPGWAKEYALTDESIKALATILDNRIEFKKALKPLELANGNIFEGLLKGLITPEDVKEDDDV